MTLTIDNSRADRIGVDFDGITPEALAPLSLDEVRRTTVRHGNRPTALGELFRIDGSPSDLRWELTGDFSAVHGLGAGMTAGEIRVDGDIGRRTGAEMSGGGIEVRGSAGDWLGAGMRGGVIHLRGDGGSYVGAAIAGARRGMRGGTILIDGGAGDQIGSQMRRGLIAIKGDVGRGLGSRMLAGSIILFGRCGSHPGAGMRRGTIGLFAREAPVLLPTFRRGCRRPMEVLRLVAQRLRELNFAEEHLAGLSAEVELWHGDFLELGRGEIVVRGASV
jgi:formylmethanofuran dehydrogenase subunit C